MIDQEEIEECFKKKICMFCHGLYNINLFKKNEDPDTGISVCMVCWDKKKFVSEFFEKK